MHYPEIQTITRAAEYHAARQPGHPAIRCGGREVSYAALDRESRRAARAIRGAGLARGSRVAYLGRDSEHFYEILLACARSETVLVPVNWRLTPAEVGHILGDSEAELLIADREFLPAGLRALPRLRGVVEADVVEAGVVEADVVEAGVVEAGTPGPPGGGLEAWKAAFDGAPDPEPGTGPDDPVAQLYTSGTTGAPKGVVLAHRSFFRVRDALAGAGLDWIDWQPGDRSLSCVPGFHVGGLWWAVQCLSAGITSVVLPAFSSAGAVATLADEGVTTAIAVPAMLQMILAEPGVTPGCFPALRKVIYGGSPISADLLGRCMDVLGCDLAQIYGLTESGNTAVCLPPSQHVSGGPRLAAAGRPYPGFELRITGPDGAVLPARAEGEIQLRTPAVMLGYWGLPEATRQALPGGWLRTGDAGYLDEEGYLFVRDRLTDTIIVAGENVYPAEVESALSRHPAVADAAVIGVPHDRWGEAVHTFVVLREDHQGTTGRELMMGLRGEIADFKIPTRYELIEKVPRNPSGKILRRVLRDQFWAGRDRNVG